MIKYELVCEHEHTFESWFRDSAGYDRMIEAGAVSCPVCSSIRVGKALMAPYLSRGALRSNAADKPVAPLPTGKASSDASPETVEALGALLRRLQREVEKNCDYVGEKFAEEARRIHYGETEARGIYGEASLEESRSLREEGVEFLPLPWLRRDA